MTTPAPTPADAPPVKNNKRRNRAIGITIAIFVLIGVVWLAYWLIYGRFYQYTDDAYVDGNNVMITPQVPGIAVAFSVNDSDYVPEGRILVELDKTDAKIALDKAIAELGSAVRTVMKMFEQAKQDEAVVSMRKSQFVKSAQDFEHRKNLVDDGGVSLEDYEHAVAALESSFADLIGAEHAYISSLAQIENTTVETHPIVDQAKNRVRDTYVFYQRCTIKAPVTGIVAQRTVQVGEQVAVGQPLMAIVPLDQMWVTANYKETQLPKMRVGQPVKVTSDIYGRKVKFKGTVAGLGGGTGSVFSVLPPQNATGNWIKIVQRIPVRITLDQDQVKKFPLRLGLSMKTTTDLHDTQLPFIPQILPDAPLFTTDIFACQEQGAEELIDDVIDANLSMAFIEDMTESEPPRMKPLTGFVRYLVMFALSAATFMIVLDYSIANVSIPWIAGDLACSTDEGTYVITAFAVGNSIALPITGWLTKRVGAVKLICISLLLFTFFSWTCGVSMNLQMLVVSRFLQGLAAGPLIPLSQTLLVMINPPEKKNTAIAFWSVVVITAPILGPILGGWITYDYHWPWIFYINLPIGIMSAAILWSVLGDKETPRQRISVDWVGLILLAFGVACLQFVLDKGEQYDWFRSDLILTTGIISFVSFTLLIVWSLTTDNPLIELKLFKIRTYALSVFYIGIMYAIYFGSVVLIPLWLQTSMNYTSIWAGIAVAPIGIVPFLLGEFTGKLVTKFGHAPLLGICFVLFSLSCFYTAFFDTDVDIWHIAISRFLLGCGLLFFITPLFSMSLHDMPQEKLPSATGIFHFVRAMSGGLGTSIFTTLWIRRSAYHHATVGENLTAYSPQTSAYLDQLGELGLKGKQGLAQMNVFLEQQAEVLAINDCNYVMGWIFLALIILLPLARMKKNRQANEPAVSAE